MFFHAGAHVGGFNHGTQTFGSGDGLQACDANAQDHDAGGFHRTGSGHQHGHEALVFVCGQHHGFVACNVGLRRQHVHALRARGAGGGFEGEAGSASTG